MRKEEAARTFTAFEQLEDTSSRRFDGLGLGLTLTHRIVTAMGGTVSLDSMVGRGTTVEVCLPIDYCREAVDAPRLKLVYSNKQQARDVNQAQLLSGPLRVLVAEDMPMNQIVIKAMIEELGHAVDCVDNGVQMVNSLTRSLEASGAQAAYDVVLADLELPGCDGIEAIRRTREAEVRAGVPPHNRIPIVVLTASGSSDEARKVKEAGGDGFLVKPIEPEQLAEAFNTVISDRRVLRKAAEEGTDSPSDLSALLRARPRA